MDQERFLHCYNSIKFQEDNDAFSIARTRRRCLALNFFGSVSLNQENDLTNYLLEKNLESYAETVDDRNPENVNNYAESVLGLIPPNLHVADKNQRWKTDLESVQLEDFVKPLSCTKTFHKDLQCCDSHFDEEHFNQLHAALNQYVEPAEFIEVVKKEDDFATAQPSKRNFDSKIPDDKVKEQDINFDLHPFEGQTANYVNEKWKGISFKTAREELHLQNLKKRGFGTISNKSEGTYTSAPIKKSLGTRKGMGVFAKFQPPTRQKDNNTTINESNNSVKEMKQKMSDEEEVDERLKHIDPKMIELIKSEIIDSGTKITWDDIAGLESAKTTIQEIVVWPMLRPDIFTGLRRPPKGILLFGPPGTGKTLIGKCIASQSCSTFFSISASSLTSKWIGDGEKMVRALFAVARCQQPAVVFIDEIDSLLSQRSDSEHESTRRLKTEFLVQLDGAGTAEDDRILIIGATNRPQELDEAARRRLVKRLYIPLPDCRAREQIIHNLISKERHTLTEAEVREISVLCEGYSGADMKNLCQEASLGPIRSIPPMEIRNVNLNEVRPLNASDFKSALNRIKSSVSEGDLDIYVKWDRQYGCGALVK